MILQARTWLLTVTLLGLAARVEAQKPADGNQADFSDKGMNNRDLKAKSLSPTLESLNLSLNQLTSPGLIHIAKLTRLKTLNLANNPIGSAGMVHLAGMKYLETLDLSGTKALGGSMRQLTTRSLKNLSLRGTNTKNLKFAEDHKGLEKLDLNFTKATDNGMIVIKKNLGSLKELYLAGTSVTDAGVKNFSKLKQLQTLVLSHTALTDIGLAEVAGIASLKELDLSHTKITDDGLEKLPKHANLKWLDLEGTEITSASLGKLERLEKLSWLGLNDVPVSRAGLEALKGLKNLTALHLRHSTLQDKDLELLTTYFRDLQELNLSDTATTDKGLKYLARLENLKKLYLNNTDISVAGLRALAESKNLEVVDVTATDVTPEQFRQIFGTTVLMRRVDLDRVPRLVLRSR